MLFSVRRDALLPVSRSSCGQFAQRCEEAGGGAGVIECIESNGGRELGGLRAETDLQHILLADGHQSVEFGRQIFLPVGASRKNDRTGFVDIPLTLIFLARNNAPAMSAPAMPNHIEPNAWRSA